MVKHLIKKGCLELKCKNYADRNHNRPKNCLELETFHYDPKMLYDNNNTPIGQINIKCIFFQVFKIKYEPLSIC